MRIVILIALIETSALFGWMIYRYYSSTRAAIAAGPVGPSNSSTNRTPKLNQLPSLRSAYWPFTNERQFEGQRDDRRPMSGAVPVTPELAASSSRAFARRSHQLMYKKWSQERRDDQ